MMLSPTTPTSRPIDQLTGSSGLQTVTSIKLKVSPQQTFTSNDVDCSDIVWLVLFVMFCCILTLIAAFALVYGNPKRLINGMDSFGNVCGTINENFRGNMSFTGLNMIDKPYVFYFDLYDMDRSTKVCVNRCPIVTISDMVELKQEFLNTSVNYCRYDFNLAEWEDPSGPRTELDLNDILCPGFPIVPSRPILKRCIPNLSPSESGSDIRPRVYGYLKGLNIFKQILGDLALTWTTVLGLTAISFVASLLLVVVLHWINSLVAYLLLILSSLLCIMLTGFLWWTYVDQMRILDATNEDMILEEMANNKSTFLIYSIVSTIFTIILLLVILVIRMRVSIVVKLFRETGAAVIAMPYLLLQPFITYVILVTFLCGWLYVVLCIATSDHLSTRRIPSRISTITGGLAFAVESNASLPTPGDVESLSRLNRTVNFDDVSGILSTKSGLGWLLCIGWTLMEYSDTAWVKSMWWLYIFGLIWCSEFILGCQQMVIASSVSTWYFSRNRNDLSCIVFKSITRMVQYHIGSVALGSLIITVIKIPRLIVQFSQKLFRKWEERLLIQWLNKGCSCCLICFEDCMKHVHHNAYTVISVQGVDFCPASKLASFALLQNSLQISVINSIGDFVLFLAKCIVSALTGLVAIVVFRNDETLYYYAMPILLTVIFSYFVAHCVISVFEVVVDTLFLCFCEDHNMNDGTSGKEFYAPRSLLRYMTVDAVDTVVRRRCMTLDSSSKLKKCASNPKEVGALEEEIIPMNPCGETITSNVGS